MFCIQNITTLEYLNANSVYNLSNLLKDKPLWVRIAKQSINKRVLSFNGYIKGVTTLNVNTALRFKHKNDAGHFLALYLRKTRPKNYNSWIVV